MGRKPTTNSHLPPQMRARRRGETTYYYYDTGGRPRKEIPLGSDYVQAVRQWGKLHGAPPPVRITFGYAVAQYLASTDFERLATGTRADYRFALDQLVAHFASGPLDEIRPAHVQMYLDKRSRETRHRAQREVALLGMIFRWAAARDWTRNNPASVIKRQRLPGRNAVYIEDDVLKAVYDAGGQVLKDAIDLAYLIGQRPGDVLALQEPQLKDGVLSLRQAKTGAALRIPVTGDLKAVIDRILARKRGYPIRAIYLLVDEHGGRMTKAKLRSRFEAARDAAGPDAAHFQFRDLRAKAASDLRDLAGIDAAQALLGHTSVTMTEQYTRNKKGKIISAIGLKAPSGKGV